MIRRHPEETVQRGIVEYLRTIAPNYLTYANPNASRRTPGGYASNGVPGLTPGIPDLTMLGPMGRSLYIEVKAKGGVLSKPQEAIANRMFAMGVPWCCAYSIDDIRVFLQHHRIETREVRL